MQTYLVYSGYILNGIVLFIIVSMIHFTFKKRRINKKRADKHAQKQLQYQEELKVAEEVWQNWVREHDILVKAFEKETDYLEQLHLSTELAKHAFQSQYYFPSINQRNYLNNLAEEYGWVRKNQPAN